MVRLLVIGVVLTLSAFSDAAAQEPRLQRLDPATRLAVTAMVDSARAAGLPIEPLVDRALEGAAKRASSDAIVLAVRRLAVQLARARASLGASASPAELEAGAAALRSGADSTVLARLRRSRPGQPLTVPLAVLADLVSQGVPADTAASAVLALAPITADDDLIEFRRNVERDIALGAPPAAAAVTRVNSLAETGTAGPQSQPPRRP